MSETINGEYYENFIDFPHEKLMDKFDISFNQLSASTQREIHVFNETFEKFVEGSLTEEEHETLLGMSENIEKMIQKQISDSSSKATGIFAGIVLAVGAFFGIKKLTEL